MMVDICIEFIT